MRKLIAGITALCLVVSGVSVPGLAFAEDTKAARVLTGDYVAIVNTSDNPDLKQSTGSIVFDANGGTVKSAVSGIPGELSVEEEGSLRGASEPAEADNVQMQDAGGLPLEDGRVLYEEPLAANEPSVESLPLGESILKGLRSAVPFATTSYAVGDKKTFYKGRVYVCIGVGNECYIWMEETMYLGYQSAGKVEKAAAEMQFVYEGEPFEMLNAMCEGNRYYDDNSGKLSILLEDTGGNSGFYAGEPGITAIHINSPEANKYTGGQYAGQNGLLVHEGQHALFRDLSCNHSAVAANSFSWINEGLAVASMDYTWGGADPNKWMGYINGNAALRQGAPLVYRSYRGSTALDYGIQYAFVRYLANQLGGETYNMMPFFNAVYKTQAQDKTAKVFIEDLIQTYNPSSTLTFEEVLTNFYVAMVAHAPSGAQGFGNDGVPAAKIFDYPIYMGESGRAIDLAGTAAVVVKTKDGSFTVPADAGADVRFVAFDKGTPMAPSQGSGTATDPYLLKTPEDLGFLSTYNQAFFKVSNDIDLSKSTQRYMRPNKFLGTIDGDMHAIEGLTTSLVGINEGMIKNLTVKADLGDEYLGDIGFLTETNSGTIQECAAIGTINARLIGGNMVIPNNFGAIAGSTNMGSSIRECFADVTAVLEVSTNHVRAGALVGENRGSVYDSYAVGSLAVTQGETDRSMFVGGAIGSLFARSIPAPYISNVYSTATVNVTSGATEKAVGSLFGNVLGRVDPSIISSYGVNAIMPAAGNGSPILNAACGKTLDQLKQQTTYKDWAFGGIWKMPAGGTGTPVFTTAADLGDITTSIARNTYYIGERLELYGSTLTVSGTTIDLLPELVAGFDSSTAGVKTIQGLYKGKSFQFDVTVKAPAIIANLEVYRAAQNTYVEGDLFNAAGVILRATLDGQANTRLYSGFANDKSGNLTPVDNLVTYTYGGKTVTQPITVAAKAITSLRLIQPPRKTTYAEGEKVDFAGLMLQVKYNDGSYSSTFTLAESAQYNLQWSGIDDVTRELKFTDNNAKISVECGANAAAKVEVITLDVKAAMKIDDTAFTVPSFPNSPDEYWPDVFPAVTGGSGDYSTKVKPGYDQAVVDSGMIIDRKPGISGATDFRFGFKQGTVGVGTYVVPFIVTDNQTGATVEVNMTVIVVPPSAECDLLATDLSLGFGGAVFRGVISGTTINVLLPSGTDKKKLIYSNPETSADATLSIINGGSIYDKSGTLQPQVVTAQDKTTKKTYTVVLAEATAGAQPLNAASDLAWSESVAEWTEVPDAAGYLVQLHTLSNGYRQSAGQSFVTTDAHHDFSLDINKTDTYVFTVVPLGNKTTSTDGPIAQSPERPYVVAPEVTSVLLEPHTVTVFRGGTQQFNPVVSGVSSPDKSVIWTLENATSSMTSLSAGGLLSIGEDEAATEVTVVATSVQTPAIVAKAKVAVADLPQLPPPVPLAWAWEPSVDALAVTKAEISWAPISGATGYKVTLLRNDIPVGALVGEEIVNDVVLDSFTTKYDWKDRIKQNGTYKMRIVALGDGLAFSDSAIAVSAERVYSSAAPVVTSVAVSPATASVNTGKTQPFMATVEGDYNPSQDVTWSIVEPVVTGTSISATGVLTVATDETAPALTVVATSVQDSTKSGTATVVVTSLAKLAGPINLAWKGMIASWSEVPNAVSYAVELFRNGVMLGSVRFVPTLSYDFASDITLTGLYTFNVYAVGDHTNFADGDRAASSSFAYTAPARVTSVVVEPTEGAAEIGVGLSRVFMATVTGTDSPPTTVVWGLTGATDPASVIDQAGKVTLGENETAATVRVTAMSTYDNTQIGSLDVTVLPKPNPVECLKNLIVLLPEPNAVTSADAEKIAIAKEAYDGLSPVEKTQMYDSDLEKLSQTIGALPNVDLVVLYDGGEAGMSVKVEKMGLSVPAASIRSAQSVVLTLTINPVETTSDANLLQALVNQSGMIVGGLYTIELTEQVAAGVILPITETESMNIMVGIPPAIQGKATYAIFRVHAGVAEVIPSQASGSEIVLKSGKFSTYALAYKQDAPAINPDPGPRPAPIPEVPPVTQLPTTGAGLTPVVGDNAAVGMLCIVGVLASLSLLAGAAVLMRRRWRE